MGELVGSWGPLGKNGERSCGACGRRERTFLVPHDPARCLTLRSTPVGGDGRRIGPPLVLPPRRFRRAYREARAALGLP